MSNVCRHRMSTLLEGRGNARSIVCPYHAWTYNLDGTLRGAPAMTLNESFCRSDIALPTVRCEQWLGWIMVTLNPDAPPPAERLSGVSDLVGKFHMENYVEAFREEFRWNTNWKVLAENFMESYHLPVCHEGTIGGHVDLLKMTCPEGAARLQLPLHHQERRARPDAGTPDEHRASGRRAADDMADLGLSLAA